MMSLILTSFRMVDNGQIAPLESLNEIGKRLTHDVSGRIEIKRIARLDSSVEIEMDEVELFGERARVHFKRLFVRSDQCQQIAARLLTNLKNRISLVINLFIFVFLMRFCTFFDSFKLIGLCDMNDLVQKSGVRVSQSHGSCGRRC